MKVNDVRERMSNGAARSCVGPLGVAVEYLHSTVGRLSHSCDVAPLAETRFIFTDRVA